jgi:hypothetical protein
MSSTTRRSRAVFFLAWACMAGSFACGGDDTGDGSSATGGAGGSDSHGTDAAHDDATSQPEGSVVDSKLDTQAPRDGAQGDAPSTTDTGGATADAADGATGRDTSTTDTGAADRSSGADAALDNGTLDAHANDAAPEASIDVHPDIGTSDDGGACGCTSYGTPVAVGTEPSSLTELSGIVASRKNPGVLYAHNDSGSNSTLIVMSDTAAPLGSFVLSNVNAVDWEDVAVGPCDAGTCIFVGEIGDNNLAYASRAIYRFAEPTISPTTPMGTQTVTADALTFVYPDGRHNAETLLVDPTNGDVYVVTKVSNVPSTVYRLPKPFTPGTQATVEKVGDLSLPGSAGLVTGGDVHPCGTRMLIRTYPMIYEFKLAAGQPFSSIFATQGTAVPTPTQDQESKGEGVTYAADGIGYFTASELDGKSSRSVFRIRCQ